MCTTLWDIKHATVLRAQFGTVPPSVGGRFGPEIEHHVEDGSSGAANQFGFERGCFLEMHAAERAPLHAKAHVRLDGLEIQALAREFPHAPRTHEASAIVFVRFRIDHLGTWNESHFEAHLFRI
jgi:hypothetical protein